MASGEEAEEGLESAWRCRELFEIANLYSQDADLWVFRRFDRLHLFNILHLQRRLTQLEADLLRLGNGDWVAAHDEEKDQRAMHRLVTDIRDTLRLYDEATAALIRSLHHRSPRPKKLRDLAILAPRKCPELCTELGIDHYSPPTTPTALKTARFSLPSSLLPTTARKPPDHDPYAAVTAGLASIAAVDKSWTHRFVDEHDKLRRMFAKGSVNHGTIPVLVYSENAIRRAERIVVNIAFCFLLICPIFLLSYVDSRPAKLATFVVFVLAGSVLTSGLISVGNIASLAVMAGYTAILVVFLSNNVIHP